MNRRVALARLCRRFERSLDANLQRFLDAMRRDGYEGDELAEVERFHRAQREAWRRDFLIHANGILDTIGSSSSRQDGAGLTIH